MTLAILRESNGSYLAKANGEPHILSLTDPPPILRLPVAPELQSGGLALSCPARTFVNTHCWRALFDANLLYEGDVLIYEET
jgi:hypothetical protein